MCGIFGFVGRGGAEADPAFIEAIAIDTEQRGHHAWGLAWIEGDGRMRHYKERGSIVHRLPRLRRMARGARALIGHCRFATHGSLSNLDNHPHPVDGGWLVHNGVIHDLARIVETRGLDMVSACDSEVLGRVIEDSEQASLLDRSIEAAEETVSELAFAGIWPRPARVVIVRKGRPLYQRRQPEGLYFSSCNRVLRGREMSDTTAEEWSAKGLVRARDISVLSFEF